MSEITIDAEVCRKDGLCTLACVRGIFQQQESGATPRIINPETCIGCGHCVAICPHGAMSHSDYPEGTVHSIRPEWTSTYEQALQLMRARRSKREFKDKSVERDTIDKVLEAARFAPSGHNAQGTEFIVVQDRETIHELGRLTAEGLRKMAKPFLSPVGRAMMRLFLGGRKTAIIAGFAPELEYCASLFDSGTDILLHNAPALLLFHADDVGGFALVDANLALQNAALAAETLGLGCFYTGFLLIGSERNKSIGRFLSLPDGHKLLGGLAMGYPRLSFDKWPERKPARVTWM
jgi:nitroreductase/NAD-dependent dihydropyrimidine dehydrogenase PreA subunit